MLRVQEEIIIAGFGGQGVLFAGAVLSAAAVLENKHTTWFPSYGAEMRGGTANSTVIISEEEIGSPVVINPSALIALNEASLQKFLPRMKTGALVIYNSSLVKGKIGRDGVKLAGVPATEIADKQVNNIRTANVVAIGKYLKESSIVSSGSVKVAFEYMLKDKGNLVSLNKKALDLGMGIGNSPW